jgi:hypothetical protein
LPDRYDRNGLGGKSRLTGISGKFVALHWPILHLRADRRSKMVQVLKSLLALTSLLILALVAVRANSAPYAESDEQWQPSITAAPSAPCGRRPMFHRCVVPGPQAGTHLQAQPFAYGYFGAHAPTSAVFHTSNRGDWYQWSFYRAD